MMMIMEGREIIDSKEVDNSRIQDSRSEGSLRVGLVFQWIVRK